MRKHIIYPIPAVLLGVVAAFLRTATYANAVDGIPDTGGPMATALLLLCGAAALLFFFLSWREKGLQGGALYTHACTIRAGMLVCAAGLLLVSAVLRLKAVMDAHAAGAGLLSLALELALTVLSVPLVVSLVFLGKDAKAGSGRSHDSMTVLFPTVFCWFWLIDLFRRNGSDPILWNHVFLLLAAVFLLLSAHGRAGFSFGNYRPRLTLFSSLGALFLLPVALSGETDAATLFTLLGMNLYTLANLTALLRGLPMSAPSQPEIKTEVSSDE